MKATEQYSPVMLFIVLYKVVRTFESVDEILKCDHINESYLAVLSFLWCCLPVELCNVVLTSKFVDKILYFALYGGFNF